MRIVQLLQLGRAREAEEFARSWIAKDPNEPDAFFWLARSLINQNKNKEAIDVARRGLELNAMDADCHSILAEALFSNGNFRQAQKALSQAIELEPDDVRNRILEGFILLRLDQRPKALEAANRALALDPTSTDALQLRSIVLARMNQKEAAAADMGQVLAEMPDDDDAHVTQGWNCLLGGSYPQASTHFAEALRINPANDGARQGLLETFRARSFIYRVLLGFVIWLGKLKPWQQIALILGFVFFDDKIVLAVAIVTQSVFLAILVDNFFMLFILLIIVKDPLFNLVVAINRETRLALKDRELEGLRWSAPLLLGMFALLAIYPHTGISGALLNLAIAYAFLANIVTELHELENPISQREAAWAAALGAILSTGFAIGCLFEPDVFFPAIRAATLVLLLYTFRMVSLRRAN